MCVRECVRAYREPTLQLLIGRPGVQRDQVEKYSFAKNKLLEKDIHKKLKYPHGPLWGSQGQKYNYFWNLKKNDTTTQPHIDESLIRPGKIVRHVSKRV